MPIPEGEVFSEGGTDTWLRVMSLAEASVSFGDITKGKEFQNKELYDKRSKQKK